MKRPFLIGVLPSLVFPLLALSAGPTTMPASRPPVVGDKPADFALDTLEGKTIRLSALRAAGPVVVLQLRGWVGYQCPICTRQVGAFIGRASALKAAGATVVLVYPGPAADLKHHADDFIAGKGLPEGFDFVLDPDMKFANSWGLRWNKAGETAYPSTFVVNSQGTVTFAKVSHSHGDRASVDQVLQALKK